MFYNDCWLSLALDRFEPDRPSSLVLLNTGQATADDLGPTQTVFHFDPREPSHVHVILDQGGYRPSPEEVLLAPFYQDVSQRVLAVKVYKGRSSSIFIVKIEVLLKLAREWGGADLEWEQWGTYTVQVLPEEVSAPRISGSRLLCLCQTWEGDRRAWMSVYDLSPRASSQYVETATDNGGKLVRRIRPSVEEHLLPWDGTEVNFSTGGHDSVAYLTVRSPISSNIAKADVAQQGCYSHRGPLANALHLWNF